MLGSRYRIGASLYPLLGVIALDHSCYAVLLAVDPDLTIVIDVGLKKDPGAGYGDTVYLFG